jgi:Spore coat assembly protein
MKHILFIIIFLCSLFSSSLSAKVWINELMQSNIDFLRDDLHEFPDSWIELYNDSDSPVNMQNWVISDNSSYQNGWKINVSVSISPKSYLLIYADKASQGLHTDFRLDSGKGGAIYLFNASGQQIDAITNIPKHPAPNIAWGRISDGNASWAYFVTATPKAANTGKTSTTVLPTPNFSQAGGVFKNSITVSLSLPASVPQGVVLSNIHYTLDNSEPTASSPTYTGNLNISQTTVVRAKIIHPDYLTDRSKVHTYIISAKDFPLPVISISTDPSYLWDDEFGIYCKGNGKYGLTGNGVDYKANWNNDWRRPINFEYFPEGSNSSVLNQLCEMRISGGWSRSNPQKSFIVYGNKRFGPDKRFEYDLFKEKPNQEIKSFMIRNSGNDFWYTHFRDAAIQLFMGGKVDIDYQAYQPTIFYLNGNYWGIQNLRERSDEDFVLANYATEDIDMFENWWELKAGDWTALNQLTSELNKSSSQRNYTWIMEQIDIDEFINCMILQIYVANTDFLSNYNNNIVLWRPRKAGGKWRFILKDTDQGLGTPWKSNNVTYNALNIQYNNDSWKLFNALLTQDSFRKKFYSRFAIYMGDLLHYSSTSQVIDSLQKIVEPAMQDHLTRWIPEMWWRDMNSWRGDIDYMKNWCQGRNAEVYKHLRDFFTLGTIMKLTLETENNLLGTPVAFINDVRMRNLGLNASYFQKENIELRYEGNTALYAWEITQIVDGVTTVDTYFQQNLSYQIVDKCTSVKIKLVNNPNALTETTLSKISFSIFENQLQISGLQPSSVISIYDISGKLVTKINTTNPVVVIPVLQKGVFIVKIQNEMQRFTNIVVF